MDRIIEVIVSPDGETTVQTKGYSGGDCLHASRWLEESLGVVSSDHRTAEFYQPAQTQQDIARRLRTNASFISKVESGERRLDVIELASLCKLYGIALDDFLREAELLD